MLLDGDLPGGLNRGVRALFEGPSGTGKTLAARVLAAELGLDLYRVDLASVVNKYIGETEKNLSRILSRAEDLDVVLLLDEGDSLMSRRTEVKSAHDRYANLETNYLLQRLETYTGIVIVTTNVGHAIDTAFRRRLDVVVKFHLPDTQERWRLWQVHLPANHAVPLEDLEGIAVRCQMTGGQIRNAAIQAAMLALSRSRETILSEDLQDAIQIEYRKAGAASAPAAQIPGETGQESRLAGFLAAIS
jgi:SpoVK/Ycf46/Vps4 family AAA+-type ATPase